MKKVRCAAPTCAEPGCTRPTKARGRCSIHYYRNWRTAQKAGRIAETRSREEAVAYARLVRAAPELLAAAQHYLVAREDLREDLLLAVARLRAAVAKATGGARA
ncbi:MAG: hypothetical protein QME96_04555 [Myxococcota bacterium]|nr:hypothetical protein [Myxococcota bacterium]